MKRTLFTRVFSSYLPTVLGGLFLLGLVSTITLTRATDTEALHEIVALARFLAAIIPDHADASLEQTVARFSESHVGKTVAVLDETGTRVAGPNSAPSPPVNVSTIDPDDPPRNGFARDPATGASFAFAVAPTADGSAWVYVTRPRSEIRLEIAPTLGVILLTATGFAVVLALLIYRTLRWINEPIYAIQGAARRYAQGELAVHLRTNGPPELQQLANDLNVMGEQLRNRIAAISEQRKQLEAVLSSMLEGVVVLDEERGIVSMNEAAGRLLGVPPAEARGRTLIEYLRNAQLDDLAELALDSDDPVERSVTLYRERPIHVQIHATPLRNDSAPRPTGSLLVINDITRLKHLEDLRKDFVANVSHELKTPITSIKGFVETLLDEPDATPATVNRFLTIILNHTNRLHLIIEDLLSLSRLEQADQRIAFSSFSLGGLVAATLEICSPRAEAKQITVVRSVSGNDLAWGNPNLLEQALVNLVDNAVKYSAEGSTIEIRVENEEGLLSLAVLDHGQGIRAQDLPRIFERFYRTDKARSRDLGGTGLGLAIVKHIARAHHGEVRVQSILGEGSTFTMEIPQDRRMPGADPADDVNTDTAAPARLPRAQR